MGSRKAENAQQFIGWAISEGTQITAPCIKPPTGRTSGKLRGDLQFPCIAVMFLKLVYLQGIRYTDNEARGEGFYCLI